MWTMFSIKLGYNKPEFCVAGVADVGRDTVQFQGICNGGVFVASENYELVRQEVIQAVLLNQEHTDGLQ